MCRCVDSGTVKTMTDTDTKPAGYPDTPTLDRMSEVVDDSQTIGEFLEWLGTEEGGNLFVARWDRTIECGHVGRNSGFDVTAQCREGRMIATDDNAMAVDGEDIGECTTCGGTGIVFRTEPRGYPNRETIEQLLARFFGIDLTAKDREQSAVLAWVREQQ